MQYRSRSVLALALAVGLAGFTAACDDDNDNDSNDLTGSTNVTASPSPSATPNTGNGGGGGGNPSPSASPDNNGGNATRRTFTGSITSLNSPNLTISERGVVTTTNETKIKNASGELMQFRDLRLGDMVRYEGYRAGSGQYFLTKIVVL